MSERGGKRENAGRKRGSTSKRSRAIANKIAEASTGDTPLEVIIMCMKNALADNNDEKAAYYAQMAAPYVHAKLAAVTTKGEMKTSITLISEFPDDK